MLEKTQVSVQPLLDEVMSAGRESSKVKGSVRLEDIEADVTQDVESSSKKEIPDLEQNKENISKGVELPKANKEMVAFNMLVEKMKSSGTLPEKPQPTVSCLVTLLIVIFKVATGVYEAKNNCCLFEFFLDTVEWHFRFWSIFFRSGDINVFVLCKLGK